MQSRAPNITVSMETQTNLTRNRFFSLAMASGFVGVAGTILLLAASLFHEYQNVQKHAQVEAENLSHVLQEHTLATVQKIDLMIRDIQGHLRAEDMRMSPQSDAPRARELHALLTSRLANVPEAGVVYVVNAAGDHIHSSIDPVPRINIRERPHFQRQMKDPTAGLVISPPLVARSTGKWSLLLSRRINFEDGSFAGIVNVVLNLEYFQQFYRSLDLGPHGTVVLRDRDLRLAARFPMSERDMGKQIPGHHGAAYMEKGLKRGVYFASGQVDGIRRLYSFRVVGDLPLVVFAGIAEQDYLAEWRRHLWSYGIGAAIFSLVVAGLGMLARRRMIEQTRAENALRESEQRLRTMADYTYDWEYWQGPNQEMWYVTPSCLRITGYAPEEFLRDPGLIYAIIHPDDQALMQAHRHDSAHEDTSTLDFRIVRKDGEVRWLAHGCRAVYWQDGQFMGRRASNRDITERKLLEEELHQLNASLERRVAEEVAQNRDKDHLLIQQSRLAAMGEMVHNIAHQWRQPLNSLAIIIANIKDDFEFGALDGASLELAVSRARRLLEKMSTTIDDFRDFFRPDREPSEFDLAKAIDEALFVMDASLRNNQIAVEKSLAPDLVAFGYPNQFSQAVLNVLANAKEAIQLNKVPAGKIIIHLKRSGSQAELSIRDNAGGIPDDIQPRIFEPYYTSKEQGSGIGLYMTKMIIERNIHGRISASNQDQGALFSIQIPLRCEEENSREHD